MISESEVMSALIEQVSKAARGRNEREVITFISRPLWRLWCRAVKAPEDSEPTVWLGAKLTRRVYGSETFVFESEEFKSYSE